MPRIIVLLALLAGLLLLPTAAEGHSGVRLRGTVTLKDEPSSLVTLRTQRQAVALRVPGSMARIRVGQRVELRGATLRARRNGSGILARNVSIASTRPLSTNTDAADDEVELKGTIQSLTPLTVTSGTRRVTCAVPSGVSLTGFSAGDFVEITCDLIGGTWVLRVLKHEDQDEEDENEDEDRRGEDDDDEDHDQSGPGGGDDGDNSGPGGGGDDD